MLGTGPPVSDEEIIDVRASGFRLTEGERAVLRSIVDREVMDVEEMGRTLGMSDEGVFAVMRTIAEKLEEFRYLAEGRTPPLGTEVAVGDGRRPKHRRPLHPDQRT